MCEGMIFGCMYFSGVTLPYTPMHPSDPRGQQNTVGKLTLDKLSGSLLQMELKMGDQGGYN